MERIGRHGRSGLAAQILQALPILVRCDEPLAVFFGYGVAASRRHFLIDHKSLGELGAKVVRTLGAVGKSPFDNTRPDRARLVDKARVLGPASIADDLFRWDAETEVLVPAIAEGLLVGCGGLDVRAVGQA